MFQHAKTTLDQFKQSLLHTAGRLIDQREWHVQQMVKDLRRSSSHYLNDLQQQVMHLEQQLQHMDPDTVLSRGYSMTLYQNKPLRDPSLVPTGEQITTFLEHGTLTSITQSNEQEETEL